MEYITTFHFIDKYLPKKGTVLDAGSGPGRYAIELAKRGYKVTLFDLAPENLEFARKKLQRLHLPGRASNFVEGSVEDLSAFPRGSFDAVLCLGGPLSHLMNVKERKKAVSELVRVAKVDAPIVVSVINKFPMLLYELRGEHGLRDPVGRRIFRRILKSGDYFGESLFTAFHGFMPEELRELFSIPSVRILEMAGLEGLAANNGADLNALAKRKSLWNMWLEAHYATCTHPAVQAFSAHELLVAKKTKG